ncbi:hypothetical protein GCM10010124_37030 [Pilimelia terevasa]|uniref:VWA domain-containing protein n=1 Tax=Pilimelia terevasa TaxID=53372 RepID=A0A8J3BVN1_9ACTN|nr:hypothetical protein [Pilimelia terevasa]GGK40784.1 hypothetical protein GCM10010124_37030 [Pilimelia terevasa]
MTTVPLIVKAEPVTRFDRREQRRRNPAVAVVYATSDGMVDIIGGGKPMTLTDQVAGRYSMRYEVDISDHHRTVELRTAPPPAKGGIYHFTTQLNIGFRVCDPGEVVRRHVKDGLQVVCDYLMYVLHEICPDFAIEEAKDAQDAVNARFRQGTTIDGYLDLYQCRARLGLDADATAYLKAKEQADRDLLVKAAEHRVSANTARQENEIDLIKQSGDLERRAREHDALTGRVLDAHGVLALHLEKNPHDTLNAVNVAAELETRQHAAIEAADQRHWEKFQFLADKNLVQAVDVAPIRDRLITGSAQVQASLPMGSASGWDEPLPHAGGTVPAGSVPGLIPIYVVIDGSCDAAAGTARVNAGLQSLYDAVAADADVARVVRLAVLTYSDRATVRMAMQAVRNGQRPPPMEPGTGPARLAVAFERLMDCIPDDAVALKKETSSLRRPQVLLLSGSQPSDDPRWRESYSELVDRDRQRYAPDVIACGIGAAAPRTMLSIATRPELAFVSLDNDIHTSVDRFWAFAQRRVIEYGRAILDGDQNATIVGPDGFRPAAELLASPAQGD